MRFQGSFEQQQIRQLRIINSQLNPGPALLKFFFGLVAILFGVFGAFGLMNYLVHLAR